MIRAAAVALAAFLLACGCGGDEGDPPASRPAPADGGGAAAPHETEHEHEHEQVPGPEDGDPYADEAGVQGAALERTARAYVAAINSRDGGALCRILAPGSLEQVELPADGGGCAGSVAASIGQAEPGDVAWRRSRILALGPVELQGADPGSARVRLAMKHSFGPGREPSFEDDLLYLRRRGPEWEVVKPSVTFHRAIGSRRIPLSAIAPP